jgi:hypothetical protein
MSTGNSTIHTLRKGAEIVADNGSESVVSGDEETRRQASLNKFHFQEGMDESSDSYCEVAYKIPRDVFATEIPSKVELNTLTHLAKRPAVDIEFQDLSYSVRNPGRRGGKPEQGKY